MEQSLYLEEVAKFFPRMTARVIARINDTTNPGGFTYLHRQMLTKEYSPDLKWETLSTSGSIIGADYVAMNSSLPLKRRDSIGQAFGNVSKMGLALQLREKELTQLGILRRTPGRQEQFLLALFADTPKVIRAPYETLEYMFLLGLSTGISIFTDPNNTGAGVRLDYKYLSANKFTVDTLWTDNAATPITDIKQMTDKAEADGNVITTIMLDRATFDKLASKDEVKDMWAASINFFGATVPTPTFDQVNAVIRNRFGYGFQLVERSVRFENSAGDRTSVKPWAPGQIVGLSDLNVGRYVWGTLAEMEHPVPGVVYNTVDDFILVSKYRKNEPSISEHTQSQGLVVPVIDNVQSIYTLDTLTAH